MAWVPPAPGMGMGRPSRWASRSMGMTTFCVPVPEAVIGVAAEGVAGAGVAAVAATEVVAVDPAAPGTEPSEVTTYAH